MLNLLRFAAFLRANHIDMVHIHLVGCFIFGILAGMLGGVKVRIIHWHNVYDPQRTKAWKVYVGSIFANRIVAISKAVEERNCATYRIPSEKVTVVYNAIGIDHIGKLTEPIQASSDIIIGSVGKLEEQKGFDTLLSAFKLVNTVYPLAILEIVGDGPLRSQLEEYAAELNIVGNVKFLGILPNDQVLSHISNWKVFVLASRWEGFGIVLLEAMAAEKPIVATNVEAIPEVVEDGVTGFLCPLDDDETIAEKIIWFLRNKEAAIEFGKKGRERLDLVFSIEASMEKLYRVYEEKR